MNWQYIVIGIAFIIAVLYIISKFYNPFAKNKNASCGKGNCGCGTSGIKDLREK